MKLSLAEVRRRLAIDTAFTGEFVGANRKFCKPGMEVVRRRVIKQSAHQMVCLLLDGPKAGTESYNQWKYVVAREEGGAIILTSDYDDGKLDDYLKITFPTQETP